MAIYSTLGDLERDMKRIAAEFKPRAAVRVGEVARDGNRTAKRLAKRSAGKHGKHYSNAITLEGHGSLSYEYGPEAGLPQGGMSFEHGSRNQPPHLDLAKSADLHGAGELARKIDDVIDGLFW